jgi:hypothetical protein
MDVLSLAAEENRRLLDCGSAPQQGLTPRVVAPRVEAPVRVEAAPRVEVPVRVETLVRPVQSVQRKRKKKPRIMFAGRYGAMSRGNEYKYNTAIQNLYGGEWIPGSENYRDSVTSINRVLREEKPEVAVIPGFSWPFWRTCVENGIRYVLVQHDISSAHGQADVAYEKRMIEKAEAVIFTSEDHVDWHRKLGHAIPPHEVIHLRPLERDLRFDPLPKLPGKTLVYTGGLMPWNRRTEMYGYRSYHRLFGAFISCGWGVHAYTPVLYDEHWYDDYEEMGVHCHTPMLQKDLYREMSQYTAGFHGYNIEGVPAEAVRYCMGCRPNKTWDYLGAGIPTIGINSGKSGDIFNGNWGVAKGKKYKIPAWIKLIERRLPVITDEMRFEQTIEQDTAKLKRLLDPILA